MPTFAFQARDKTGQPIQGTREAADQRAALESLREAGFFVTELAPARNGRREPNSSPVAAQSTLSAAPPSSPPPVAPPNAPMQSTLPPNAPRVPTITGAGPSEVHNFLRANAREMALWFRQMHSMIDAGTALSQALHILADNAANKSLRTASREMSLRTATGQSWSETMRAYPGLFSPLMIGMIAAGEKGGFLDRMCLRLAEYAERDYELQQTIKRETWYPKLLVFSSIFIPSVVPLVLTVVGVQAGNPFLNWLKSVGGPLVTVLLVWGAWKALNYFAPLAKQAKTVHRAIDFVKLCIPIGGKAVRGLATAKFCRALGAMYSSGAAPHPSVELAAGACGNAHIEAATRAVIPRLERGETMSVVLAATGQFKPIALQMLRTGEESGKIDTQLDKVADFLEADAETTIKQAVKALGILVFLIVAASIGMQVVHFYSGYTDTLMKEMDQ